MTPTERRRAEEQFAAAMLADHDSRDRQAEVWHVLISRPWDVAPSFEQLFDDLTAERAARLGELYDALPAAARAEYDRRYGPPDPAGRSEPGDDGLPGMSAREAARWRSARTFDDVGELTAQWLEGRISRTPARPGPPVPGAAALLPLLAAASRAGFVTYQHLLGPAKGDESAANGHHDSGEPGMDRRVSLAGFADDDGFARLMSAVAPSDLTVSAARGGADDAGRRILDDGYLQACNAGAIAALRSAWHVGLMSPRPRGDDLRLVLERFAEHLTARPPHRAVRPELSPRSGAPSGPPSPELAGQHAMMG